MKRYLLVRTGQNGFGSSADVVDVLNLPFKAEFNEGGSTLFEIVGCYPTIEDAVAEAAKRSFQMAPRLHAEKSAAAMEKKFVVSLFRRLNMEEHGREEDISQYSAQNGRDTVLNRPEAGEFTEQEAQEVVAHFGYYGWLAEKMEVEPAPSICPNKK